MAPIWLSIKFQNNANAKSISVLFMMAKKNQLEALSSFQPS